MNIAVPSMGKNLESFVSNNLAVLLLLLFIMMKPGSITISKISDSKSKMALVSKLQK